MPDVLKAPFPWFGGKSRVAHLVWERFGDVPHYVEPFFGSGAVLLRRPDEPRTETINDFDCYVANFWRALQKRPRAVAAYADWPINEADLHARHVWLVEQKANGFRERMQNEPEYFDAKIAGWWAWGLSCWIGSGWCEGGRKETRPEINAAKGVHSVSEQVPRLSQTQGVNSKRPILTGWSTKGVHKKLPMLVGGFTNEKGVHCKRPNISGGGHGTGEKGVNTKQVGSQRPSLLHDNGGVYQKQGNDLLGWMLALAARLRRVRVCCGDWSRICTDAVIFNESPTAVFLDPPYSYSVGRDENLYSTDSGDVANLVRDWAIERGNDKRLRIALCGYAGEHEMPADWDCVAWKAPGGYGNQAEGRGKDNAERERIWFSPGCLPPRQRCLF